MNRDGAEDEKAHQKAALLGWIKLRQRWPAALLPGLGFDRERKLPPAISSPQQRARTEAGRQQALVSEWEGEEPSKNEEGKSTRVSIDETTLSDGTGKPRRKPSSGSENLPGKASARFL
jgi:hypothetical protein